MVDYCPNCGADDSYLEAYMNGETICTKCGYVHDENEEEDKE
jgi:transcription initiation factor TFIIIB Brf1 subunit/transcription initiation factor TFIIB